MQVLSGGYKAFRAAGQEWFACGGKTLLLVGGYTGSGKTAILHALGGSLGDAEPTNQAGNAVSGAGSPSSSGQDAALPPGVRMAGRLSEPVVDLEGLARHKGSVFGALLEAEAQPTCEHFENLLHMR